MADSDKSLDILGAKPLAEAAKTASDATIRGIGEFLSRICLPAAEEFGLLVRDKVSAWRSNNALALAAKAEALVDAQGRSSDLHAHPRIVGGILGAVDLSRHMGSHMITKARASMLAKLR